MNAGCSPASASNRTAAPRHQSLQAALEWSYDLLCEPERVLLEQVSYAPEIANAVRAKLVGEQEEGRQTGRKQSRHNVDPYWTVPRA